jgi:hypothetical protein
MSNAIDKHDRFVDELRTKYRSEGYEELNPSDVRRRLRIGYLPDLAVKRGDEVTLIEVKNEGAPIESRWLQEIKSAVESNPGWHFRFFVVPDNKSENETITSIPQANASFAISQSTSQEYPSIAVVTLSMSLETAMRHLLAKYKENLTGTVSMLAMGNRLRDLGFVDDDDVRTIAALNELRHRAIHGYEVNVRPSGETIALVERLMKDAGIFQKSLSEQRFVPE